MNTELENQLLTTNLYSFFRGEVTRLGLEGFFREYNVLEMYTFLETNRKGEAYKLFVCLAEKDFNTFVHFIKDKKDLLTHFIKQNDSYYSLFAEGNYETFTILFQEFKNNPSLANCNYSFLTVIPYEVIKKYLERAIPLEDVSMLINYNHAIRADFFLKDARALPLLLEGKLSVSLIINSDLRVSEEILHSDVLFEGIKGETMITFRNNFNKVLHKNPSMSLIEKMENYEKNLIESFDIETEKFHLSDECRKNDSFLCGIESTCFYDKKVNNRKKFEDLIVDYLFNDNIYNVIKNIKEMIRYQKIVGKVFISPSMLAFYQKMIEWKNLSTREKLDLYKKYKDANIHTKFYEDIRLCREISYQEIIEKLYRPQNKNEELFKRHHVAIYILNGQDFTMLIRGLNTKYHPSTKLYRECFSLIDQDNLAKVSANFYYGYVHIDYNKILHVSETDSYSHDSMRPTSRVNRIMTSEEINSYYSLSEIQITTGGGYSLQPDYVVAFDKLSEEEIEYARRIGLPIVFIDSSKYKNKKELIETDCFSRENYVMDADAEFKFLNSGYKI